MPTRSSMHTSATAPVSRRTSAIRHTGCPRRCGWFDAFATRYSIQLGGIQQVALMHLDTLGGLPEVRFCSGYQYRGKPLEFFTPDIDVLNEVQPIYETLPGWPGEREK